MSDSAGHTGDIRSALLYISAIYPRAPLIGIGFSLGANIMTRYIGEEGPKSRLRAACVVACPWDCKSNSHELNGRFWNRLIFSRALGSNVASLVKSHIPSLEKMPPSLLSAEIPTILAMKKPALEELDEHVVRICGGSSPPFPFATATDYWEWASSHQKIPGIAVPFLAVNAVDDPIVAVIPYEESSQNPWMCLVTTRYGGHLGWYEGGLLGRKGKPPHRWLKKPVLEWFAAILDIRDDLGAGSGPENGNKREERDGFVVEVGHPLIGYRVLQTGLEIGGNNSELLQGL